MKNVDWLKVIIFILAVLLVSWIICSFNKPKAIDFKWMLDGKEIETKDPQIRIDANGVYIKIRGEKK